MGKATVTPEVAVMDAESEPKYVNIGNDRENVPTTKTRFGVPRQ